MLLYHRTSVSQSRAIIRDGFVDEKWRFGSDDLTGEPLRAIGVWLTDRPLPPDEGPSGAAVVEVSIPQPEEALSPFEVLGVLPEAHLWIIPAKVVNQHAGIRVSSVDASASGFHQRFEEPEE